ncbi:Glycoside hydrolase-type carbohydrate-binding, subgroup [Lasallia pustulata]|uniref:Glucose-6-phosphate 1-epimerase n=1 Tax=Lasallia pustulata TaxID=136370 RepID=A0A1W5CSG3_9LECA|nr:Glycoside hydrolase-type carbohydrate-binding, subgroup [Lasallia pustulata]
MVERGHKPSNLPVSPQTMAPQARITNENGRVNATLPSGEFVEVLLHGATIISWKTANGKENLFVSSKARLDGSKAVRGGIPIVFPVFGPPPKNHATSELPQHGLARTSHWEYLGKTSSESTSGGDSSVKLDFGLSSEMVGTDLQDHWPEKFGLTYSVTLSPQGLETSLQVSNVGKSTWEFQVLLHTYLRVDNISDVIIQGLEATPFTDKVAFAEQQEAMKNEWEPSGSPAAPERTTPSMDVISIKSETDRVYHNAQDGPIRVLHKGSPRFEIVRDMLGDVVVWNPWEKKAAGMNDMGEGEWKNFVCVEAGSVSSWTKLESGETWEASQIMKAF